MDILLFILIAYGFSNIVVYGSIFERLREFFKRINPSFLGDLFSCMMCFPTWVGFLLSIIFFSPTLSIGLGEINIFNQCIIPAEYGSIFFDGILASATTWFIHTTQEMMERAFN